MARASSRNPVELYMSADVTGRKPGVGQENGSRCSVDRKRRHLGQAPTDLDQIGRQQFQDNVPGTATIHQDPGPDVHLQGSTAAGRCGQMQPPGIARRRRRCARRRCRCRCRDGGSTGAAFGQRPTILLCVPVDELTDLQRRQCAWPPGFRHARQDGEYAFNRLAGCRS